MNGTRYLAGAALIAACSAFFTAPAAAGEAELALLSSYVGDWRGEGVVQGGDRPDPFRCRLTVSRGNVGKINYAGRCTLVNANLSITGTIAYDDAAQRYQAVMSSNAGFTGVAVGRHANQAIHFDLQEQQKDRAGSDVRLGAKIQLADNQITVNFEMEFNDSGDVLTTTVPFAR